MGKIELPLYREFPVLGNKRRDQIRSAEQQIKILADHALHRFSSAARDAIGIPFALVHLKSSSNGDLYSKDPNLRDTIPSHSELFAN